MLKQNRKETINGYQLLCEEIQWKMDYEQREATKRTAFLKNICEYRISTDFYVMLCYKSSLMRLKVDHWPVFGAQYL